MGRSLIRFHAMRRAASIATAIMLGRSARISAMICNATNRRTTYRAWKLSRHHHSARRQSSHSHRRFAPNADWVDGGRRRTYQRTSSGNFGIPKSKYQKQVAADHTTRRLNRQPSSHSEPNIFPFSRAFGRQARGHVDETGSNLRVGTVSADWSCQPRRRVRFLQWPLFQRQARLRLPFRRPAGRHSRGANHYAQPRSGRCRDLDWLARPFRVCRSSRSFKGSTIH